MSAISARFLFSAAAAIAGLFSGSCASIRTPDAASVPVPREPVVRLQIFLDSHGFGPGVIDGRTGEFTEKALSLYRQAHGLPAGWRPDVQSMDAWTDYRIREDDLKGFAPLPGKPPEIAKLSRLPYENLTEMLAERFRTRQAFLRELNPDTDINSLPAGATIRVPAVVKPFRADAFPSRYPAPSGTLAGRRVIADTRARMLKVMDGQQIIAAFPITPGSDEHPALPGELRITGAVPWPWYRYDEGVLKRGERTADYYNYPPGPNSPVGILWAGVNRPGVGIHGTSQPETIGRAGSHGCIRLSNWDAATFYTLVKQGTPVTIL